MAARLDLDIGSRRDGREPVALGAGALLRHLFAVGASGSGKTVFCKNVIEQATAAGIPAICVDPQGDLASIALAGGELGERIDPVIFTPASAAGVPVCADPIRGDAEDPTRWATRAARMLVSALGYDLGSDDGDGLAVAFAALLARHRQSGGSPTLPGFIAGVGALTESMAAELEQLVAPRALAAATRRLRRLDTPGRRELFCEGLPIEIGALLERRSGRTPVSVIYLNTLESQEDKELVVATLVDRVVRWMLARPSPELQLLFYIDEVAPFLPPVRKPACKEGLVTLLKQARKYGVGCLIATQNPGDVDYRALGQLGSWAVGRLVTRQDLKKIEPQLRSLAGDSAEPILADLPRLGPGQLWLLSPDSFERPVALRGRRLQAPHETLDIERVREIANEYRDEIAPGPAPAPAPESPPETGHAPEAGSAAEAETEPALTDAIAGALAGTEGLRAVAVADRVGRSEGHVRKVLRRLVDGGQVTKLRRGREVHYLWIEGGGRADLELGASVRAAARTVGRERATTIARNYIRSRLFGLLGDREQLADLEPVARGLYAVDYREPMRPGRLERLLGQRDSHLEGTVYLEPASLELLHYNPGSGIRFDEPGSRSPTAVDDLDGQVDFVTADLEVIGLDQSRWSRRRSPDAALERFRALFSAEPLGIRAVFVPLWRARYRQSDRGAVRVLLFDGLGGHPVQWPA